MRSLLLLPLLAACAVSPHPSPEPPPPAGSPTGILVMAHGGSPAWNRTVEQAAAGVGGPTVVAFGMADPASLTRGLDSLASLGARRVAVVRLFVSGESFLEQTRWLLGLADAPPATFLLMNHGAHAGHDGPAPRPGPIRHGLEVATHRDGLMDADEAAGILRARARSASGAPASESVLLLAHGMGDERENERLLDAMERIARGMSTDAYARVATETLREDWPAARAEAEQRIRGFVSAEASAGRRVIVVPMRLSGFGPYAAVLEGLDYVPTEGLLPHDAITTWIRRTAHAIACSEGWSSARPCDPVAHAGGEALPGR